MYLLKKCHVGWVKLTYIFFYFLLFHFYPMSSGIDIYIEDSAFLKIYITLLVFYLVVERLWNQNFLFLCCWCFRCFWPLIRGRVVLHLLCFIPFSSWHPGSNREVSDWTFKSTAAPMLKWMMGRDGRMVVEYITGENCSVEDIYYKVNTYSDSHVHKCTYSSFVFYNKFSQPQIKVNIVSHGSGSQTARLFCRQRANPHFYTKVSRPFAHAFADDTSYDIRWQWRNTWNVVPSILFLEMTKCQLRDSDRLPLAAAHYLTPPPVVF